MKRGDIIEGTVVRCEYPGKGIMTAGGREVSLKGVIPGQRIRCRIKRINATRCEASLMEVLEHSYLEKEEGCVHFPECGGCQMQTIPYADQLEMKASQIRNLLQDSLIDPADGWFEGIHPSPEREGYRNKMEFTFGDPYKDGPLVLGMHKRGGFYDIVDTAQCRIIDSDIRAIRSAVLETARQTGAPYFHRMTHNGYFRHLLVRKSKASGQILAAIVTTTQPVLDMPVEVFDKKLVDALTSLRLSGTVTGILHIYNDSVADVVKSDRTDILYGTDCIVETLLGMSFQITPFSFFQTNSAGTGVLYDTVRNYIGDTKDKVIYDLYSGTGTISQILAPVAKHVTGVEIVEEAVEAAKENAKRNGLSNCDFICGDVLKVIDHMDRKPDLIVLDPPRDGIHPKALPKIIRYGVDRIVYISCKATSLKRDLVPLQQAGYRVERLSVTDMFPDTMHVETIVLLQKLNS